MATLKRDEEQLRRFKRIVLLLLFCLFLQACSPLTLVDATLPEDSWKQLEPVDYGADPRQKLDIYIPADGDPKALLVFFYGGSWDSGERADYRFVAAAFTAAGYAVAIPDYRLYPQVRYPAFLEDSAEALAALAAHPELGVLVPERTFIAGHSAGAWISVMLALETRWLRASGVDPDGLAGVVGIAGPYDFDPARYRSTRRTFGHVEPASLTQPLHFARKDAPPLLLLHGAEDTTVEPVDSRLLAERIQAMGGRADYLFYDDIGHLRIVGALAPQLTWIAPVQADILSFMEARLAGADGLPVRKDSAETRAMK
ncbi:alpha/beta hydrolase [Denitrobaculum tricleocarpae]|uniref:Alpha/beta hydrolase n=1 Tax=Denitrobaculum tricleocarpae TaxID=2591009 RepID=A0A545TYP3_9PROT|nr:alpha/beta hydrolase [Denitrobaculum tricleocarpae]TQV82314.1 alpha/beta hydrolase [Denitrobaculum tricleocarpae]